MKNFQVIVTRDITESVVLIVEAWDFESARDKAYDAVTSAGDSEEVNWEIDDGSCGTSAPYITGVEEIK